jgi:thiamine kinase-like enzyme
MKRYLDLANSTSKCTTRDRKIIYRPYIQANAGYAHCTTYVRLPSKAAAASSLMERSSPLDRAAWSLWIRLA